MTKEVFAFRWRQYGRKKGWLTTGWIHLCFRIPQRDSFHVSHPWRHYQWGVLFYHTLTTDHLDLSTHLPTASHSMICPDKPQNVLNVSSGREGDDTKLCEDPSDCCSVSSSLSLSLSLSLCHFLSLPHSPSLRVSLHHHSISLLKMHLGSCKEVNAKVFLSFSLVFFSRNIRQQLHTIPLSVPDILAPKVRCFITKS